MIAYLKGNQQPVLRVLEQYRDHMLALAQRKGTSYRNPIVDTGNAKLRDYFKRLSQHYLAGSPLSAESLVIYVAELFNKVRNNPFHGVKVYDDESDRNLLREINPILTSIINQCEHINA